MHITPGQRVAKNGVQIYLAAAFRRADNIETVLRLAVRDTEGKTVIHHYFGISTTVVGSAAAACTSSMIDWNCMGPPPGPECSTLSR